MNKVKKLKKLLDYIPEGKGIHLGDDVFLVGKELDGSDKCYGFYKEDSELFIVTRECSEGYSINNMDKEDLNYIFNLSNIHIKLSRKQYEIVEKQIL